MDTNWYVLKGFRGVLYALRVTPAEAASRTDGGDQVFLGDAVDIARLAQRSGFAVDFTEPHPVRMGDRKRATAGLAGEIEDLLARREARLRSLMAKNAEE